MIYKQLFNEVTLKYSKKLYTASLTEYLMHFIVICHICGIGV